MTPDHPPPSGEPTRPRPTPPAPPPPQALPALPAQQGPPAPPPAPYEQGHVAPQARPPVDPGWHAAQQMQQMAVHASNAAMAVSLNRKSAGAAAVLSILFTGAGQWYCGRIGRGFAFLGAAVVSWVLAWVLIGFLLLPIVWIWALIDAISLANQHNQRLTAALWQPGSPH
jgi:TM2 domain-containing membrane protein YozV